MKISQRVRGYLLFGVGTLATLGLAVVACQDFPESTFRLADESRLPKWVTVPAGLTRADVSLTINFYTLPYASFVLQGPEKQTLQRIYGKVNCIHPIQLKKPANGSPPEYPGYEAVTVSGITEMFEQRRPEDIMYVADDDAAIWKQYRRIGCD